MTDFICLGLSTLDNNWFVPHIPDQPRKVLANRFLQCGGGMAATAAVTIARLGASVSFWGRRGDDSAGDVMANLLSAENVDTEFFRSFNNAASPIAAVIIDSDGERLISTYQGHGLPASADWLPLHHIKQCSVVLADMRWVEGAIELFKEARACQIPTVLDADIAARADYPLLLPHCDHAIFSSGGLEAFAPGVAVDTALTMAIEHGCSIAGVSNGKHGIRWRDATNFNTTPAFSVPAVDTTGAGDVLHGAYAWATGNRYTAAEALQFASATAALACCHEGARNGIPDLSQVQAFLDNNHG